MRAMKVLMAALLGLGIAGPAAAHAIPDMMWAQPLPPEMWQMSVRDVQGKLKELGCYRGPVDGIVGKGTTGGIRTWQRANGAPVNGVMSEPVMQSLLSGASLACRR